MAVTHFNRPHSAGWSGVFASAVDHRQIGNRSVNDDRIFVDTNVLVCSYYTDAGQKHDTARSVLMDLWGSRTGAVSTQVLQEFYVTVTRKLLKPLAKRVALEVIGTYRAWPVHRPEVDGVIAASEFEDRHQMAGASVSWSSSTRLRHRRQRANRPQALHRGRRGPLGSWRGFIYPMSWDLP